MFTSMKQDIQTLILISSSYHLLVLSKQIAHNWFGCLQCCRLRSSWDNDTWQNLPAYQSSPDQRTHQVHKWHICHKTHECSQAA